MSTEDVGHVYLGARFADDIADRIAELAIAQGITIAELLHRAVMMQLFPSLDQPIACEDGQ